MAPDLPLYASLPSSSSTAGLPQLDPALSSHSEDDATSLRTARDKLADRERDERQDEDETDEQYELTDREGREGLLSGRRKDDRVEGEDDDDERRTLEDALRVESGRKGWTKDIQITPRCSLLTLLFLASCLLLLFLFHPSSPYSHFSSSPSSKSGLYSPSTGYTAQNPLESDSKYAGIPFAKVGGTKQGDGRTPTWAGGDEGESEVVGKLGPGGGRRWNGTHWWDPTVILVSLDGVRADYLERGLTPHLLNISRKGMRAEYLEPCFPSITFPNHWSILTGLYPSSHGIVANDFWDPKLQKEFVYTEPGKSWEGEWWGGEPIWSTAVKAGLRSAVLMWPGPPIMADGTKPTLWYPFVDKYHFRKKVERVAKWLDMPYSHRPHLMTVYSPTLDQAGHKAGPSSKTVDKALGAVDEFIKGLFDEVERRNLTEVVEVVVVSDHGMADSDNSKLIYLDDLLSPELFAQIDRNEGWPNAGLRPLPGLPHQPLLSALREASASRKEGSGRDSGFECYDTTEGVGEEQGGVLERWHFSGNERISPIYCVPNLGYAFTTHAQVDKAEKGGWGLLKGNHGYDNILPEMRGIFVAHGPFSSHLKQRRFSSRSFSKTTSSPSSPSLVQRAPLPIPADPNTLVLPGFSNLEIYGLVAELLRIPEEKRARTEGTRGAWVGLRGEGD
ncbi:hypothetical protein JCM11251_007556 [Rhodosporidiobolus azoricus]